MKSIGLAIWRMPRIIVKSRASQPNFKVEMKLTDSTMRLFDIFLCVELPDYKSIEL